MQLIGLGLLVAVVLFGFDDREMSQVRAFDLHALVIVLGGSAAAILTASRGRDSLRTLLCLRELLPFAGTLDRGTAALESARQRFAELWRDGRRAQAVELAEQSPLPAVRAMLRLVLARANADSADTVFMELRHAELTRWQPATSNWELLARLGPSFGMVGTVTGMIQLFQSMGSDDLDIGAAISLALVATLYGIAFGAGVAGPIGHYLRSLLDARLGALSRCRQTAVELAGGG
ncbi:MAG: MotA/TolQ/ExbB proton channel family protein [Myxococcales bacterium]|nr:MotA/TolQ/ExbB proton channel family protein [Myxococcales bacterium]